MWDVSIDEKETPTSFLTLETSSPFAKLTLVRDIQEAQEKLGEFLFLKYEDFILIFENSAENVKFQKIYSLTIKAFQKRKILDINLLENPKVMHFFKTKEFLICFIYDKPRTM